MLDLGLFMAGELLEEKCARDALARLGTEWDVQSLATRMAGRIFHERTERTAPAARAAFYLKMEDRWLDRARYAMRVGIELDPGRGMWASLPPHIVLLCYAMHSLRSLGRYVIRAEPLIRLKRAVLRWIERTR